MRLFVKVSAGAKETVFMEKDDGWWRIKVAAKAKDNEANDELLKWMASKLGIGRSKLKILRGFTGRYKTISLEAELSDEQIFRKLSD